MSRIVYLPGLIDIHVHLRDPGQTYKEDFYTGTSAALAGGVTCIFDMPNNLEPIFTYQKLLEKLTIAEKKAVCDWGLYFGTDGRNTNEFGKVSERVIGLKVYLNLTTGKISIEDEDLVEQVFKLWPKQKIIVVHAEGEKVDLALFLASKYGNKIHVTHVSQKVMLEKILEAKKAGQKITCDVTPHHLFLTKNDIPSLGGFGVMKPPLESKKEVDYLWDNISQIDCIATDHAPHTIEEKKLADPPTGVPGLETMLPLLLTAASERRISVDDVIRLTSTNPRRIFDINQGENTYVEVDLDEKYLIEDKDLTTKCGWSPFAGWEVVGKVKKVYIRGVKVSSLGKILVKPGFGMNIRE